MKTYQFVTLVILLLLIVGAVGYRKFKKCGCHGTPVIDPETEPE